ncbi:MAG: hypothetical protein COB78_11625 [Hyphomicrobiales bacterium]|nr:MAG: hypothetical protein COB78_11625 [Hyphomicrobiales bacterium]
MGILFVGGIGVGKWLKKYMEIEYLEKTLENRELFLGKPEDWPDKNDGELIQIYKVKKKLVDIRVTCLTMGPDRFHFWKIFGKGNLGVCLWFDKKELLLDIKTDQNLREGSVCYFTPTQLKKNCSIDGLPFAKREQYSDEKEFRVLREYDEQATGETQGIAFNPNSLKKIYFNSWLSKSECDEKVEKIKSLKENCYKDVEICQNKTLEFQEFINAAKCVK